jgi:uncharacterized repeat protein (TIGR02543 family)
MKTARQVLSGFLAICMIIACIAAGSITTQAAVIGDDYPSKWRNVAADSVHDDWHMLNRECTSFVAWRLHSQNGFEVPSIGNAKAWGGWASNNGYAVNGNPAVGSVAWTTAGTYGHVAWVADVNGDNITIEEYNAGYKTDVNPTGAYYVYNRRTVNKSDFSGYIHFRDSGGSSGGTTTNNHEPEIFIDGCTGGTGTVRVWGWAYDRDNYNTHMKVAIWLGGGPGTGDGPYEASCVNYKDIKSHDAAADYYYAFDITINTGRVGNVPVYIYPKNIDSAGNDTGLASSSVQTRTATVTSNSPTTYTISYNANGGSGAPGSQTKSSSTALRLSSTVPIRFGYSFWGWGMNSSTTQVSYFPGDYYYNNFTTTLYAIWASAFSISTTAWTPVSVNFGGKALYYTYTPTVSGTYQYLSSSGSSIDPVGTIYDSSGSQLASNDDGAGNRDFLCTYDLTAGVKYYFKAWLYNSSNTGDFSVILNRLGSTYTVTYNANGGTGAPAAQIKTENQTLYLSSTIPTRTGYTFLGWSTSSTATSATYSAGGSYTVNAAATLYAVWRQNAVNTYTITYNVNGGTGAPASQTKIHGTTLYLSSTIPTRTGYTFLGWAHSMTSDVANYSAGGAFTSDKETTLYAVWQATIFTITYDVGKGTGAPASQTKLRDVALTLSSVIPTYNGYTFSGWEGTQSTGDRPFTTTFAPGSSLRWNQNTTFYAIWRYTVRYDANGGTGAPADQNLRKISMLYQLSEIIPTRTGYTFLGWSTSRTATIAQYQPEENYAENGDVTLYAVWGAIAPTTYTVTFDVKGGGSVASQTVNAGMMITLPVTRKDGFIFRGWATNSGGAIAYGSGDSYTADANATLYAVWEEAPPETYALSVANGSGTGNYAAGATVTITANAARDGERFLEWFISPTVTFWGGSSQKSETVQFVMPAYEVFATPFYEVLPAATFTVAYDANGGTGAPAVQTKTENQTLYLSNTVPARGGYTFLGWATSNTFTAAQYQPGGQFGVDTDTTLYAVWEQETVTPPASVDKTALNTRINELSSIQKGNYTDESWADFQNALNTARNIANNTNATQNEVNTTLNTLNTAYARLHENALPTPPQPQPDRIKHIFTTKYEATPFNWFLFIVCFGWLWMWF